MHVGINSRMGRPRMRSRSLALIGAGLAAAFAIGAPTTQAAAPPHWYLQESGSWVSLSGLTGLVEQMTPETLSGEGELAVYTENEPHGEKPVSNCLAKDTESIEDPSEATLPGTGSMEAFEVICEKGTGSLNAAYPTPCLYGEGFELKGVDLNWPSVLESGTKAKAKSRATSGSTGFDSVGSASSKYSVCTPGNTRNTRDSCDPKCSSAESGSSRRPQANSSNPHPERTSTSRAPCSSSPPTSKT